MRSSHHMRAIACLLLTGALAGCDAGPQDLTRPDTVETEVRGENGPSALDIRASLEDSWSFAPPVFGIGTAPNGNILVPETVFPGSPATETTIVEVRRQGKGGTQTFNTVSTVAGSPIQDVAAVGRGSLWLTSGGLDLAVGAGVWHVTPRQARQVGDVETFETTEDPDAVFWKDPACEAVDGFSAGPQSNPYRVVPLPDGRMLVADAALGSGGGAGRIGGLEGGAHPSGGRWRQQRRSRRLDGAVLHRRPALLRTARGHHGRGGAERIPLRG